MLRSHPLNEDRIAKVESYEGFFAEHHKKCSSSSKTTFVQCGKCIILLYFWSYISYFVGSFYLVFIFVPYSAMGVLSRPHLIPLLLLPPRHLPRSRHPSCCHRQLRWHERVAFQSFGHTMVNLHLGKPAVLLLGTVLTGQFEASISSMSV